MAPQETTSKETTDTPLDSKFKDKLIEFATWAEVSASKSNELAYEWLALGFGLGFLYLTYVLIPRNLITLIDIFVLVITIGGGIFLYKIEKHTEISLKKMARDIKEKVYDSSS